jgi:hypothetical protein
VEIWPTHLRSEGATIGFVSFFATVLAFNSPASLAFANIGWRYYFVFVAITIVTCTFMAFYFPEVSFIPPWILSWFNSRKPPPLPLLLDAS